MNRESPKPADPSGDPPRADDEGSILPSFIALAFVLLLVVLGVWLFTANRENQELQHCFAEQRHDCVPLDTTSR